MGKKIRVVCKDRIFDSVVEAARYFGICSSYITKIAKRYKITYGEAAELISDKRHRRWKDHKGNYFKTFKQMCEYHGVNFGTAQDRFYHGFDLSIVLSPLSLRRIEFKGKTYNNISDMLKKHGKNYSEWYAFRKKKKNKTLSKEKLMEKFFTEK